MINNSSIDVNDSRQYLQMLQDIINRMAANSSSCKAWMIAIFTGMSAFLIGVESLRPWIAIMVIPSLLFYLLDAFYLGLENDYRDLENAFIEKLKTTDDCTPYVYNFNYSSLEGYSKGKNFKKGLRSNATWPLYLALGVISIIIGIVFYNYKPKTEQVQQLEEPLRELVLKQEAISKALDSLTVKYKPVQVESKSFHNSSFFQADNVDSVQVNVIRGEVRK